MIKGEELLEGKETAGKGHSEKHKRRPFIPFPWRQYGEHVLSTGGMPRTPFTPIPPSTLATPLS